MSKLPDDDGGGILMPILVSLLVVAGIGTAGLFAYIGIRSTTYQPEEVPASSVSKSLEQTQAEGQSSFSSGNVMYIDGVRVTPENNDTEGQIQVNNEPDDVYAGSAEPSAPEVPDKVPEEENKAQTTQPPEKQPESKPTQPSDNQGSGAAGQKDGGKSDSGQTGTGKTPENQTQTGVNINPSSPTTTKPQNSGTNMGTQAGGDVSSNFAAGKVLITTASDNNKDPVYHTKYCRSAQKIEPNDMYWYDSAETAEANNRRLCGNCAR